MKKMKFTIFTPTYNRAYSLSRLYESLLRQDYRDFEWLVVDDGSVDDTKNLIEGYIDECKLNIRYIYQENGGKHRAINRGVREARGEYFFIVDSDDYLVDNGMMLLSELADKIANKKDFAGFTGIHFADNWEIDISKYGKKEWVDDQKYDWEFHGEMGFCYKTKIMRKFPFPEFSGEKFCPESVVHRRIHRAGYHILFTDNVLMRGDYMEDGLSAKYYHLLMGSPRQAMVSYREKIWDATTKEEQLCLAKAYWDIALKAKHIPWMEKMKGIPIFLTISVFSTKIKNYFS